MTTPSPTECHEFAADGGHRRTLVRSIRGRRGCFADQVGGARARGRREELASAAALHPPRWWADAKPEPAAQPAAPGPGGASSGDDPLGVADPQTSFGWAFDRDDEPRVRPPRRFNRLLVVGVLVLVVALVMLATNLRDRARSGGAENPGATSGPTAPLAEYVPRGLTLMVFEDRVQIAWQPPEHFGEVLGYMVVVQARDGTVIERVLLPGRETTASFRSPRCPPTGVSSSRP